MREKLIELLEGSLRYAGDVCGETGDCSKCQYDKYGANCGYAIRADYLIANGVTIAKWIPVTERLPEEDGQYLVFEKHTYGTYTSVLRFAKDARKVDKYDFHRGWKNVWYRYDSEWGYLTIDEVTHWMPLPEPPKGE